MNLRSGKRLVTLRPLVENLEDRCVLSGFNLLSSLTHNSSLLAPLTNPGSSAPALSTPSTNLSNLGTTVTSVLSNVLDTVANPNLTTGNTLTGITSALTSSLTNLTSSPSSLGSLTSIVNALNGLTGAVTNLTGLVGATTSGGGLNLQVNLNNVLGGLNLGGLVNGVVGGTVGGLLNNVLGGALGGLVNNVLNGVGNLLGNVLNDVTSLTVNIGIGPGLQLSASVNTEIVGNLVGPGTHITVQAQTPVVSTSIVVSTETSSLPSLLPPLPPVVGANPLLAPSNLLRTDSRGVGGGGTTTELLAGGPTTPEAVNLPAGEALAAQNRPQPLKENAPAAPAAAVAGPFLRGLFGFVPEVQPVDPDAAGVALIVPAAPAGADAKADAGGADGGRGMTVTDTPQVAAGLDAGPQSESPQYANILADASPFDLAAAEAALARFMNQVKEVSTDVGAFIAQPSVYPWLIAAAAAAGAFEYRRRTRRAPQGLASTLAGEETVLPWLVDAEGPMSCKPN